jgi:hypothetical protein
MGHVNRVLVLVLGVFSVYVGYVTRDPWLVIAGVGLVFCGGFFASEWF